MTASKLLDSNCAVKPDFVSVDCEDMDESILKSFPLESHRPELFGQETISYSEDNTEEKRQGIPDYTPENNYMIYADTSINTIFIDHHKWHNRSTKYTSVMIL